MMINSFDFLITYLLNMMMMIIIYLCRFCNANAFIKFVVPIS